MKRILIAPLDWGYGHATRCIPVIHAFLEEGAEVIVGGSESTRRRILEAIPGLEEVDLPGYGIRYSKTCPAWMMTGLGIPRMLKAIRQENNLLNIAVKRFGLNGIVSDNRYGLYHPGLPSALITHQLRPVAPGGLSFAGWAAGRWLQNRVSCFDEVWIPDEEPGSIRFEFGTLSGRLSIPVVNSTKVKYAGLLSRFKPDEIKSAQAESNYSLLVVASGISPQREKLIQMAAEWVRSYQVKAAWILPEDADRRMLYPEQTTVFVSPDDSSFLKLVNESDCILSRPGYSALSDWLVLNRGAVLVPTPGQTEQEYLAERLHGRSGFTLVLQEKLVALSPMDIPTNKPLPEGYENTRLKPLVVSFMSRIR